MRVPDIPPTTAAGYAAETNLISVNNYHDILSDKHYFSLHGPLISSSGYNISSGEEFVRRALNSSFTEICNNYDIDTATPFVIGEGEASLPQSQPLKQHCDQFSDDDVITKRRKNMPTSVSGNTRRYSINKISNIGNIEENHTVSPTSFKGTTSIQGHHQDTSSISLLTDETNQMKNKSNNNLEKRENEASANEHYYRPSLAEEYYGEFYDDNYHSIIDLGSEAKSVYDNDEKDDIFLTSPPLSSDTLQTTPHFHFPRGIINPNYPGFQHLAYTLSEHFRGSSFDIYDSDISDTEKEFSGTDSLDSLVDALSQTRVNVFNNDNNNNLQYLTLSGSENVDVSGRSIQIHSRANSENNSPKHQTLDNTYPWPQAGEYNNNLANCSYHSIKELDVSATYSKLHSNIINPSSPPDILVKNIEIRLKSGTENQPDILSGVNSKLLRNFSGENAYVNNQHAKVNGTETVNNSAAANEICLNSDKQQKMTTESCSHLCIPHQETNDDIINLAIVSSPVNIIGDFGLEVEHEFGLLVNGYKRLDDLNIDDKQILTNGHIENTALNVTLSKDEIMNSTNCLTHMQQVGAEQKKCVNNSSSAEIINNNEHNMTFVPKIIPKMENAIKIEGAIENCIKQGQSKAVKYQKRSYDDRQLPPVAIEYKIRHQKNERNGKKSSLNSKLIKYDRQPRPRSDYSNRSLTSTKHGNKIKVQRNDNMILIKNNCKRDDELELHQYQQLLKHKDEILSNSKYTKLSSWAQYLRESIKNNKDSTTSTLELIDAYKIGPEIDVETLEQHIKLAKEIEKKRRSNREEIRRRLAMGNENEMLQMKKDDAIASVYPLLQNDVVSDADETNSSDSETCPKLSKFKFTKCIGNPSSDPYTINEHNIEPYHNNYSSNRNTTNKVNEKQIEVQHVMKSTLEDIECDFFTKQAKLQIETRMALAQAKEMAHRQMEVSRQNHCMSPITVIIRDSLEQINVLRDANTRRVSRHLLTELNIAQLQILVNNFQTYIKELNDTLVNYLMERDDLHLNQDTILSDVEELTSYLGITEQIAHQERLAQ